MAVDNLETVLNTLEKQELENATAGIQVPGNLYAQMLAIYLYQNDLCNAKFLWKRIPAATKSSHEELQNIWKVGQQMWKRDFPETYTALNQQWSPELTEIMENIKVSTRERAGKLVATAYSFIGLDTLAAMSGLTVEQAAAEAISAGWSVDKTTNLVKPCKPPAPPIHPVSCEEQLSKLTDFVSFLEN